ncbi:hypothetical protein L1987_52860 [Smallanthus sonchifolius]|uniref:Uncharacterized protein n=1 Tax=Smallanthus sonchifolius TaxID=185202 RepID=A0ACB9EUL5_9ASTR|nr:hypothetical protein L1987_52860 [Smallanthus sonchifolius]
MGYTCQRYPQSHHSEWVAPYPTSDASGQGSSGAAQGGLNNTRDMTRSLYESVFGQPLQQELYDARSEAYRPYKPGNDDAEVDEDEDDDDEEQNSQDSSS